MNIKLNPYKLFNEVALQNSFSKAATRLCISQPAVSQIISQLESDLKIRLFTRTTKGVVLTKEGETLFEYVNAGINLIEQGEKRLNESKNLKEGVLRIGVGDTITRYYLINYLEKFNNKYPKVKLKIINRTTMELTTLIKSGEIDIAVLNLPIEDNNLEIIPTKVIKDILVAGEKYSILRNKIFNTDQLSQYQLIMLDRKSKSREYVEEILNLEGVSIEPDIELGSHELVLEFARIGLGLAFVVEEYSKDYLDNSNVFEIRINKNIPTRNIGICYLKEVSLSPSAEKFIEILLD